MGSSVRRVKVPNGVDKDPNGGGQAPNGKFTAFAGRVQAEATKRHLNQASLAKELQLTSGTFSRYWNGERLPPADTLIELADLLGVSPTWLVRGIDTGQRTTIGAGDAVEVDEIDLRYGLGASYIDSPIAAEKRTFSRAWLRNFTHAAPEHLFWTIGDGDSMEPTIRSGEVILIDSSQNTPRMAEGIWAVAMGEIGMVKRLHFPGRGRIELRSDNQLVPPIAVGEDELHVIGRVVAVVRRL